MIVKHWIISSDKSLHFDKLKKKGNDKNMKKAEMTGYLCVPLPTQAALANENLNVMSKHAVAS